MTDFSDDMLVYVDPGKKAVIGPVEWSQKGRVVRKEMPPVENRDGDKPKRRATKKRYYPWCSYRTAKKVYSVEGKVKDTEEYKSLDEVITLSAKEPFWN